MSVRVFVACMATIVAASSAQAASITNRDGKELKLTVIEGDAKQDHLLKASGVLDGVCLKGCVVRINDSEDDEYELEGSDVVSVEDGVLFYDRPEGPATPGAGDVGPPSQPKK